MRCGPYQEQTTNVATSNMALAISSLYIARDIVCVCEHIDIIILDQCIILNHSDHSIELTQMLP